MFILVWLKTKELFSFGFFWGVFSLAFLLVSLYQCPVDREVSLNSATKQKTPPKNCDVEECADSDPTRVIRTQISNQQTQLLTWIVLLDGVHANCSGG